jgi:hypothetical protein
MKMLWVSYYFDQSFGDFCIDGIFTLEKDARDAVEVMKKENPEMRSGCAQFSFDRVQLWIVQHHRGFLRRKIETLRDRIRYLWGRFEMPVDVCRIK